MSEEMDIITVVTNVFLLINYSLPSSDYQLSEFIIYIMNYVHYES